ncbi:MAG: anion transporter [Rhizobiaceae bacterium]|nr:anion transporter [Rhizobiaceae bacterium]
MTAFVTILFCLTYLGMAAGRVPGSRIDRSGIAMIAAVLLVATGALTNGQLIDSIHFPTLMLLGGLMILSARVRASGLYDALALWIARRAERPLYLLALTIAITGVLSAFLVNDVVVFAMTPLLCRGLSARNLDPRPYLFGLAAASNAGSAATLIGNPQNILIGQIGGLDFWKYLAFAAVPALASLLVTFACIAFVWRTSLEQEPEKAWIEPQTVDRPEIAVSGVGLIILLTLFATPLPREISALLVAAGLMVSRKVPSRQFLDEIDLPLIILFGSLFIVIGAFSATGLPQVGIDWLANARLLPDTASLLALFSLVASNTIGNVPAVVLLLKVWQGMDQDVLTGLAILSTLAGNLLLVGSLANLIVAERAQDLGVRMTFWDHARAGIPITLASLLFASVWLVTRGYLPM